MRLWSVLFLLFLTLSSVVNADEKVDDFITGEILSGKKQIYQIFELKHQTNTYFAKNESHSVLQYPSVHFRARLGTLLYQGALDAHVTVGVIKIPETQMLVQARPEVGLDLLLWRAQSSFVTLYNRAKMPFSEDEIDTKNQRPRFQGSIFNLGFSCVVTKGIFTEADVFGATMGFDCW